MPQVLAFTYFWIKVVEFVRNMEYGVIPNAFELVEKVKHGSIGSRNTD